MTCFLNNKVPICLSLKLTFRHHVTSSTLSKNQSKVNFHTPIVSLATDFFCNTDTEYESTDGSSSDS